MSSWKGFVILWLGPFVRFFRAALFKPIVCPFAFAFEEASDLCTSLECSSSMNFFMLAMRCPSKQMNLKITTPSLVHFVAHVFMTGVCEPWFMGGMHRAVLFKRTQTFAKASGMSICLRGRFWSLDDLFVFLLAMRCSSTQMSWKIPIPSLRHFVVHVFMKGVSEWGRVTDWTGCFCEIRLG